MLTVEQAYQIFRDSQALLEGHFRLTSGLHSNQYIQCAQVLKYPQYTECLAKHIADYFQDDKIDLVIGPAMGGMIIAYEVARQLDRPSIFTERKDGVMELRRSFSVEPGQKVLVVEDVITTGGSVQEVIDIVKQSGGEIAGVGVLVDRSGGKVTFGVKQVAVLNLNVQAWKPEECPLCAEGLLPVVKPGSRN
ncbi:MAG: orotate phosphoribosyltransferase [Syntrophomonadaceae bacterium]|nr:orotate phosphoribosyltransferase [Syntrophomonadaceae bacterium]